MYTARIFWVKDTGVQHTVGWCDFTILLSRVRDLKLTDFLFLDFPFNMFGL